MTATATPIPVGINALLSKHYAAVKRRLGLVSMPTNRKEEHIANAIQLRKERRVAHAKARRDQLEAAGFIGVKTRNAPRPDTDNPLIRLAGLPFDDEFTPELREPIDIILRYFGVAWPEIVGPSRIKVVASARAAVISLLVELNASPYTLAKLLGRDESTIRTILRVNHEETRALSCVLDAINCAKHNGLVTLRRWKLPADKTIKRKDR